MNDRSTEGEVLPGLFLKLMLVFLAIFVLRVVASRAIARRNGSPEKSVENNAP
jgi:hypothetical protein